MRDQAMGTLDNQVKTTVSVEVRGWKTIQALLTDLQESGELERIIRRSIQEVADEMAGKRVQPVFGLNNKEIMREVM